MDAKLSPHFTLHEMLASQTAVRKKISEQFSPPEEVMENLKFLCDNLLEKVRAANGNKPLIISSGYRCAKLNKAVGGAATSQHLKGHAADIDLGSRAENEKLFKTVRDSDIVFDQLLNEFDFAWVHMSLKREGNRRQVLNIT